MMSQPIDSCHFKRLIPKVRDEKDVHDSSFWILSWYGRTYWNKREERWYKEVFLINAPNNSYKINKWNTSKTVKVEIPEEKTVLFSLGSLFDRKGKYISYPNPENHTGVYHLNNISIHPKFHYFEKGLDNLLEGTTYPQNTDSDGKSIYSNAPYYKAFSFNKMIEVIVPIHVITSYFYFQTTLCTHHIIHNTIRDAIKEPIHIEDDIIVPYLGNIMRLREAKMMSRYLFIQGSGKIKYLINIYDNLVKNLYIDDVTNVSTRNYLKSRIPFDDYTKFNFVGQYITSDSESKPNRFIAYGISNVSLFKDQKKFSTEKFSMMNLIDRRSLPLMNPDTTKGYVGTGNKFESKLEEMGDCLTNTSTEITDLTYGDNPYQFLSTPEIKLLDKTTQTTKYELEKLIIKNIDEISDNIRNGSSSSSAGRGNALFLEFNSYYEILCEVITKINGVKGFMAEYVVLKYSKGNFSYPPVGYETTGLLLVVQILYKDYYYCLIDRGYKKSIPIFRYKNNPHTSFLEVNDPTIDAFLKTMIFNYNNNWRDACTKQKFDDENIYCLPSVNHPKYEFTKEKAVKSLSRRIVKQIKIDYQQ